MRIALRLFAAFILLVPPFAASGLAQNKPLTQSDPANAGITDPAPVDTREADSDARERREWLRERFGGELSQDFARRVLDEAAKARSRSPDHFASTEGASSASTDAWRNLGPTSS